MRSPRATSNPMKAQPQLPQQSDSTTEKLLQILLSNNRQYRPAAARALAKIRTESAVTGLLKALESEDEDLRSWAAWALGEIKTPLVVSKLIQALARKNSDVRIWAIWALGKIDSQPAAMGLIEALNHQDKEVRWRAASALGRIGDRATVKPLLAALKDESHYVRGRVASALGKIGDDTAINGLVKALKDPDQYVRLKAVNALEKIASLSAVEGLIEALNHPDVDVRGGAVSALGEIGLPEAVAGILQSLNDEDLFVRGRAAEALGKFDTKLAIAGVVRSLSDREGYVRWRAISALGKINHNAILPPLREQVLSALKQLLKDENALFRQNAAELLQQLHSKIEVNTVVNRPGAFAVITNSNYGGLPHIFISSFTEAREHILCQHRGHLIKYLISIGSPGIAPPDGFTRVPHSLRLEFDDIAAPKNDPEYLFATPKDIAKVIKFVDEVTQFDGHFLIHCQAGISRSAAIALTVCNRLLGAGSEAEALAYVLAAKPQAMPNLWVVELADAALGRKGKLLKVALNHQKAVFSRYKNP